MEIPNYIDHTSCLQYKNESKTGFKYMELEPGECLEGERKPVHHLIFIMEGNVFVQCDAFDGIEVKTAGIVFLPKASSCQIKAVEHTVLVSFSFEKIADFCDKYSLQSLCAHARQKEYQFQSLAMKDSIRNFLVLLNTYLKDGLSCGHLHEVKERELFILFRSYYTKDELASFFFPLVGTDVDFKNKVLECSISARNAGELAQLMGIPLPGFRKMFVENFGEPVYQWMLKQRSQSILYQLMVSDMDMKTIAYELGFSSLPHFSNFCIKRFGLPPTELKKQIREKASHQELLNL